MQPDLFSQPPSFYDTIHTPAADKKKEHDAAEAQEATILRVFESGQKYTPLAIERITGINHDSVKRAITVLTKKGRLQKLGKEDMVQEARGRKNHRWQLLYLPPVQKDF